MKKFLTLIGLCAFVFTANAQRFTLQTSDSLLGARTIFVTSSTGVTNYVNDFYNTGVTNLGGVVYTNNFGVLITNWGGGYGTNTVVAQVTNGIQNITNDYTPILGDAWIWPDVNGNLGTNLNVSFTFLSSSVTTGSVAFVFAPVIKGPLIGETVNQGTKPRTMFDTTTGDYIVKYVAIPSAGYAGWVNAVQAFAPFPGVKGYRLTSVTVTNGNVWLGDVSINGWKGQ